VRFVQHPSAVYSIAWRSPDRLLTGSRDGRVREIDVDAGTVIKEDSLTRGVLTSISATRGVPPRIVLGDSLGAIVIHALK